MCGWHCVGRSHPSHVSQFPTRTGVRSKTTYTTLSRGPTGRKTDENGSTSPRLHSRGSLFLLLAGCQWLIDPCDTSIEKDSHFPQWRESFRHPVKQIVARNTIDTSTERNGEDLSSLPHFFLSLPSLLFIHYLYHELAHILTKQFDYYSFFSHKSKETSFQDLREWIKTCFSSFFLYLLRRHALEKYLKIRGKTKRLRDMRVNYSFTLHSSPTLALFLFLKVPGVVSVFRSWRRLDDQSRIGCTKMIISLLKVTSLTVMRG